MRSLLAFVVVLAGAEVLWAAPPFQNVQIPQRTSPYLNLLNQSQQATPYHTLVRPQLENLKRFKQGQLDLDRLERVNRLSAQLIRLPPPMLTPPRPQRGISQSMRATGHQTRFLDNRRFSDVKQFFPPPVIR
jgi:hypothetical protein